MKDLLNSLTDGNRVSADNNVKRTLLYGPDTVQYGNSGTANIGQFSGSDYLQYDSADQRKGAFMQQGSTMHQMPPNPTTAKPLPKHIQYLNKQGDCNCDK